MPKEELILNQKFEEVTYLAQDADLDLLGKIAVSAGGNNTAATDDRERGMLLRVLLNKKGYFLFKNKRL